MCLSMGQILAKYPSPVNIFVHNLAIHYLEKLRILEFKVNSFLFSFFFFLREPKPGIKQIEEYTYELLTH